VSELTGTKDQPITVRSFPGDWAVLDGGHSSAPTLTVNGHDTRFMDFEITKTDPDRKLDEAAANPDDSRRGIGASVLGPRTKLINLVVHDAGNGIGVWQQAHDAEVYGCLVFNNGWIGVKRVHGHGIYVQNSDGAKTITDNVVFNNFGYGIHGYGHNAEVRDLSLVGNIVFGNGSPSANRQPNLFAGTERKPVENVDILNNILYHTPGTFATNLRLGYERANNDADIRGNVVVGGYPAVQLTSWDNVRLTDNLLSIPLAPGRHSQLLVGLDVPAHPAGSLGLRLMSYEWNKNQYFRPRSSNQRALFRLKQGSDKSGEKTMTFESWRQETGFDASSTFADDSTRAMQVLVRPHAHGGPARIAVIGSNSDTVRVDLDKAGLDLGDRFEIKDAQAPSADPIVEGTYDGRPVDIPLTQDVVQQPVGHGAKRVDHTPRDFAVFLLYQN
jgi:parallel beta-helix repeat protein